MVRSKLANFFQIVWQVFQEDFMRFWGLRQGIAQCVRFVMIERAFVIVSCVQNTILYLEQMVLLCIEDYGRNEFSIPLEME